MNRLTDFYETWYACHVNRDHPASVIFLLVSSVTPVFQTLKHPTWADHKSNLMTLMISYVQKGGKFLNTRNCYSKSNVRRGSLTVTHSLYVEITVYFINMM
jgi:hypothetical protein